MKLWHYLIVNILQPWYGVGQSIKKFARNIWGFSRKQLGMFSIFSNPRNTSHSVWKLLSERTYRRIKQNAESILNTESHRLKTASYRKKHDDERIEWESHCKKKILDLHKRKFAVKLSVQMVQQILINEAENFHFDWLKKLQFTHRYAERYMLEKISIRRNTPDWHK